MDNYQELNSILVGLFDQTIDIEQNFLISGEFKNISVNDMHIIDAIGPDTQINMSSIAKKVGVTVGTLTIAINSLVRKEYVHRIRSEKDRRVVLISLTDKGRAAYQRHQEFHELMARAMKSSLTDEQAGILVTGLSSLRDFFKQISKDTAK